LATLAFVPLATLAGFAAATADSQEAAEVAVVEDVTVVEDGRRVSIEYTLTIDDGTVVETRAGEDAVEYEHGGGPLLKALQDALAGLAPGDSKKVTLTPEQGFGPVNPELFDTIPAETLPESARQVGAEGFFTTAEGQKFFLRVHELKGDEIIVNRNHPLAGKTLHFDVRIISVE
jgi:FKBP-type peptidyl-prolyl cis-trans isomerase SlyD